MVVMVAENIRKKVLEYQRNEITEHIVYERLAKRSDPRNERVLRAISEDEMKHYNEWREITGQEVRPRKGMILKYNALARIFGITFAIKLMENGEESAQQEYAKVIEHIPWAKNILRDEIKHEEQLVAMIDEEKIGYIGSMVLGVNDALVELTGALAGLSFAFQNTRLVAMAGLITGIAAAMSMGASEYLSQRHDEGDKPGKAALYTGLAYILTVFLLVAPFFLTTRYYHALPLTLAGAVLVIFLFTFFVSVVKDKPFKRTFGEMLAISLGVAALSFMVGYVVRMYLHVDI